MNTVAAAVAALSLLTPAQLPPLPVDVPLPPPPECLLPPLPPLCPPPPPPAAPDDDLPTFPGKLQVERKGRWVFLLWRAARDDVALAGYRFYRDGNYLGRRGPGVTSVRFLVPCGAHRFRVEAVDSAGQAVSLRIRIVRNC